MLCPMQDVCSPLKAHLLYTSAVVVVGADESKITWEVHADKRYVTKDLRFRQPYGTPLFSREALHP